MAGLAGLVSLDATLDRAKAVSMVEAMGRVQAHRSRPGWNVLANPAFVHLTQGDDTPPVAQVTHGSGDVSKASLIAFDGVITNRDVVRKRLRCAGREPRSCPDSGLVLQAWEQWGIGCLEHLVGRFAFVVHDPHSRTSYLVRDQFGHKPFHYAVRGDCLYFASEIKTLLVVAGPPVLNERALLEWSLYGNVLPPRTLFQGILTLAPGHVLEVNRGRPVRDARPYYNPADVVNAERYADNAARTSTELLSILESAADAAVASHMDGRSDVGVMLSGGVDSTVIAALAARHGEIKAYNFSIRGDERLDERSMAERVAGQLGLPLEVIAMDASKYRRELARTTYLYEMPLWHMQTAATQLLARRAREDGIGLLLSGVSVGPLVGASTDRYRWILRPPLLDRVPKSLLRVAGKAVYAAFGLPVGTPFFTRTLGVMLQMLDGGDRFRMVQRHDEAYSFLQDHNERRIHVMRASDNAFFLPRFFYQGDRLCMAESVEYCDAAVDTEYMAMALNMPTSAIFRRGDSKWILKELATRYVSRDVAFQQKISLDVSVSDYFSPLGKASLLQGGFLESYLGLDWSVAKSLLASASDAPDAAPFLFQMANIEIWGRLYFMNQSVEEVTSLLSD